MNCLFPIIFFLSLGLLVLGLRVYFFYIYTRQWRVRYPDGEHSIKMTKPQAQNYANIFNGEVYKDKNND